MTSQALQSLDSRTGVSREDLARLEFLFVEALEHGQHGIPNLEKQIVTSPAMFVQAVAMVYKRDDNGEDPAEWRVDDPEAPGAIGRAVRALLKQLRRIPRTFDDGPIEPNALGTWLAEVQPIRPAWTCCDR